MTRFVFAAGLLALLGACRPTQKAASDAGSAVLAPNVHVVPDSALAGATVGPTELVFPRAGNDTLAALTAGAILANGSGGGFLRNVTSVAVSSSQITFQTTDAKLTDAVISGHMEGMINFNADCATQSGSLGTGCQALGGSLPLTINLSGTTLYDQDGISVVITQGTVTYNVVYTLNLDINGSVVTGFQAQLAGPVTLSLQITASATAGSPVSFQTTLWTSPTLAYNQLLGSLPVGEVVTVALNAGLMVDATGAASISGGYSGSGQLTLGAQYGDGGSFSGAGSESVALTADPQTPVVETESSATVTVTLTPQVELTFFALNQNVAEATMTATANVAGTWGGTDNTATCPSGIDWTASAELSGTAMGNLSVLGTNLGSFDVTLFDQTSSLGSGIIAADGGQECSDAGTADAGMADGGPEIGDAGRCSCNATSGCSGPLDAGGVFSTCPAETICDPTNGVCVSPHYTVNGGEGTVTDNVTGLVWQQTVQTDACPSDPTGGCLWAHAETYCEALELGGHSGWMLPTLPQLFSLVDLGNTPTIDTTAFPDTPEGGEGVYWSSWLDADNTNYAWVVSFNNGNNDAYEISPESNSVRCVWPGESQADAGPADAGGGACSCDTSGSGCSGPMVVQSWSACPTGRVCDLADPSDADVEWNGTCAAPDYTVHADAGTVTDNVTGLLWQQDIPPDPCPQDDLPDAGYTGICAWSDAQTYCQNLHLGGYSSGWRLPTLAELFSLVDIGSNPTIDQAVFPLPFDDNQDQQVFWTSSTDTEFSDTAWCVFFAYGSAGTGIESGGSVVTVRCVR